MLRKRGEREEKKKEISIEEFLEKEVCGATPCAIQNGSPSNKKFHCPEQRFKLGSNLTPITEETFKAWKEKRRKMEEEAEKAEAARRMALFKSGKVNDATGREMFGFDPSRFEEYEDEEDAWEGDYNARESEHGSEAGEGEEVGAVILVARALAQSFNSPSLPKKKAEANQ